MCCCCDISGAGGYLLEQEIVFICCKIGPVITSTLHILSLARSGHACVKNDWSAGGPVGAVCGVVVGTGRCEFGGCGC